MALVIPLKQWRLARLLTQQELAGRAGISVAAIGRIEGGQPARISTVRKLLRALDMSMRDIRELADGDGNERDPGQAPPTGRQ